MIAQNIFTRVRSQFGDATGIQVSDQDIFDWINNAQRDIAYASNLIETRAIADVRAGQSDYTLPTDQLTIINIRYRGTTLQPMSIQERDTYIQDADNSVVNATLSTPTKYWIFANTITLYPTPDTSEQSALRAYYTRAPNKVTLVTDDLELPVAFHNTILDRVLQWCHEKDENWQAAQIKKTDYQTSVAKLAEDAQYDEHESYPSITTAARDSGGLEMNWAPW